MNLPLVSNTLVCIVSSTRGIVAEVRRPSKRRLRTFRVVPLAAFRGVHRLL
jgi:hypothetical protein